VLRLGTTMICVKGAADLDAAVPSRLGDPAQHVCITIRARGSLRHP
jgi:hypothetical protein